MPAPKALAAAIANVAARIKKPASGKLNEQNTKATLIEPILRALGWDTEDVDEVVREYRTKPKDSPVDYGLLVNRNPKLFVEAKAIGGNLADPRWANQIMGYASVAGVEWIVLTNGDEYQIYNALAKVHVDEKRFRSCRISEDPSRAAELLALLAKDQLDENRIEVLWQAHFVDRQVKAALESFFDGDRDLEIVNAVQRRTKDLSADDVRASLRRCDARFDFPLKTFEEVERSAKKRKVRGETLKSDKKSAGSGDASLRDIIAAGALRPPVELFKLYKGQELKARIERDGTVVHNGSVFDSLSRAGSAARGAIVGVDANGVGPATNGWLFWKYRAADGSERLIGYARKLFTNRANRAAMD